MKHIYLYILLFSYSTTLATTSVNEDLSSVTNSTRRVQFFSSTTTYLYDIDQEFTSRNSGIVQALKDQKEASTEKYLRLLEKWDIGKKMASTRKTKTFKSIRALGNISLIKKNEFNSLCSLANINLSANSDSRKEEYVEKDFILSENCDLELESEASRYKYPDGNYYIPYEVNSEYINEA